MQGTYVFAPDGRLLARRNTNGAEAVESLLREALARVAEAGDAGEASKPPPRIRARGRWEDSFPRDGLVLRRTARDLPSSGDPADERALRFNRDAVWFSREEARSWVPAEPKPGAAAELPAPLARRLAALVFVDNARGQTIPYAPSEVKRAEIRSEVTGIDGDLVRLALRGATEAVAEGPWLLGENDWKPAQEWPHAMSTRVLGSAVWDRRREAFVSFEVLALGWRQGRTVMCGRGADPPPGPIGFVLELAPPGWEVAPAFVDMYDVSWVRHPESPRPVEEENFSVVCWVRTDRDGESFPALLANKDWDGGEIVDFTGRHDLGRSRSTGALKGFALALQPNGSWSWSLGDGEGRLDYRPTFARQPVADGRLHMLAFSVDRERNEARLYHDGRPVAVYSLAGLGLLRPRAPTPRSAAVVSSFAMESGVLDADEIARRWTAETGEKVPTDHASEPLRELSVLAWNVWHGGRRDGEVEGLRKTVEVIRLSGADLVCMQETYGSGAEIADALGFHLYLRSSNISVLSRYPIVATHDLHQPFRFGGVTVETSPGRRIEAFSLWINHLPDIGEAMKAESVTAEQLVAAESATRGREIAAILSTLEPRLRPGRRTPLIVAGDFNGSSHLDWTEDTRGRHRGLVVPWPVSLAMERYGFADAFRTLHPDAAARPGRTWSPRFPESYEQRIDYVYARGALEPIRAEVLDTHPDGWPSDHAAVLVRFRLIGD